MKMYSKCKRNKFRFLTLLKHASKLVAPVHFNIPIGCSFFELKCFFNFFTACDLFSFFINCQLLFGCRRKKFEYGMWNLVICFPKYIWSKEVINWLSRVKCTTKSHVANETFNFVTFETVSCILINDIPVENGVIYWFIDFCTMMNSVWH